MAEKIMRYDCAFPIDFDDAQIECWMIEHWNEPGVSTRGKGLFFHYKRLFRLYWPNEDEHRWEDESLRAILANQFTTLMGSGGSAKTSTAAKFALCFYSVWPNDTLILVSSTDMRGLELRVWGRIKELVEGAKSRFDWFPGNVINYLKAITTDDIEEKGTRSLRRGLICIPCLSSSGGFVGLGKFIGAHQHRLLLVADECFPAGTMVDTPKGRIPIEKLQPGDWVINALGRDTILGIRKSTAHKLCRLTLSDGRQITCTPNHSFLTQWGWVKAVDMSCNHYMLSTNEASSLLAVSPELKIRLKEDQEMLKMRRSIPSLWQSSRLRRLPEEKTQVRFMRSGIPPRPPEFSGAFLRTVLLSKMEHLSTGNSQEGILGGEERQAAHIQIKVVSGTPGIRRCAVRADDVKQSNARQVVFSQKQNIEITLPGRKWTWADTPGICFNEHASGRIPGFEFANSATAIQGLSLQNRCGNSSLEAGHRSGRAEPFLSEESQKGCGERFVSSGAWVDSCEIFQPKNIETAAGSIGGIEVYNLHVEKHHSYSVNGLLSLNCQLMASSFLDAVPNLLNNPISKFIFLGNPLAQNDPLDRVSEPKAGWSSIGVPKKTMSWPTRYMDGLCLNLPGLDSPNYDYPAGRADRFGYMVGRQKEKLVRESYGEGSQQYCSQILGVRVEGLTARKVITREICVTFDAFRLPVWFGEPTTRIYAVDAAYGSIGGDLCIGGWIEFGPDLNRKQVLCIGLQKIIPVSALSGIPPDDQIALFVKQECESLDIDEENVFFDGRTMLMAAFARLWNGKANPVDFGARPTDRPVSLDMKIVDPITGETRLKLCREHYSKFVTELWFSIRYTIESGQLCGMTEEILNDAVAREWKTVRNSLIEVETKTEMKKRTGKSPDRTDQLATAIEGARRRGFHISKLSNPSSNKPKSSDFLKKFVADHEELMKSRELQEI